jgi:hypothetical protein
LVGFPEFGSGYYSFLNRMQRRNCLNINQYDLMMLGIYGNMPLKPSWHIMENLPDAKKLTLMNAN